MTYFKSLLFNFLAVFFVNHIIPGIHIDYYTKLPHVEGDLIFSFVLGFINSLIFPLMRFFQFPVTHFKIGFMSFIISFTAYSLVNILPLGIHVRTAGAFLWSGVIVWFCSYLTNHLEMKQFLIKKERQELQKERDALQKERQKNEEHKKDQ